MFLIAAQAMKLLDLPRFPPRAATSIQSELKGGSPTKLQHVEVWWDSSDTCDTIETKKRKKRGTHFDGHHAYDSTDLSLLFTTAEDEVAELMLKGVSHKALAQLDKHSDEQSLQRISEHVTADCGQIYKMARTDVPELLRPWFVFSFLIA